MALQEHLGQSDSAVGWEQHVTVCVFYKLGPLNVISVNRALN